MKSIYQKFSLMAVAAAMLASGCTKLEEGLNSTTTQEQAETFLSATADLNVLIQGATTVCNHCKLRTS